MNLAIRWNQIINDPVFRDLPFKVELNKFGQILMSPASNWHGVAQSEIVQIMTKKKKKGKVINECSIMTRDGVRVADVAWASDEFIKKDGFTTPYPVSPDICVEIYSPSNTREEIEGKASLYLLAGASEVWIVKHGSPVQILTHNNVVIPESRIVGKFKFRI